MRSMLIIILATALSISACGTVDLPVQVPATSLPTGVPPTAGPTQSNLSHVDWLAYQNDAVGFSIQHPLTWQTTDENANPVVFTLLAAPGTTLLDKSFEVLTTENAAECKEKTFDNASSSSSPEHVNINGIDFLKETGGDVGAGNIRDWTAYSVMKGTTCITVIFVLHSANAGVYSTEPAPFDRAAEAQVFDELINTFKFK